MKNFIIIILIFSFKPIFGQVDTININQYDNKNKKHGYWIEYTDQNLKEVSQDNAVFKYYALYFHGKKFIGAMYNDSINAPNWKVKIVGKEPKKTEIQMLDGVYVFEGQDNNLKGDKKGFKNRVYTQIFKEGELIFRKTNWDTTGFYYEELYFDKKNHETEFSYLVKVQVYNNSYKTIKYWIKKGRKRMSLKREKEKVYINK